ncbi:MAG: ribosomal L7Ae/L30e/S12e/Gadd45 family protein [Clostridia bacterium]|nr:ribosomal L7Ae/L30e/S12e/Gadd45 family protein [Clostridia bacterium]
MSNDITQRLSGMIGLCARARKLAVGTDIAADAVRSGKALLLMLSFDASQNTKKKVFNCAKYYEVPCYEIPITTADLGHCVGKLGNTAALAVLDRNMTKGILKILNEYNQETSKADQGSREV